MEPPGGIASGSGQEATPADERSPFQGLGFYTEADAKWFFGRSAERKIILAHLRTARLTLLYAESGVGKSSLLRAGVAARLRELAARRIDTRGAPRFVPIVFSAWKDDPVEALIAAIEQQVHALSPNGDGAISPAAGSGDGLAGAITAASAALGATLVIISISSRNTSTTGLAGLSQTAWPTSWPNVSTPAMCRRTS